MKPLTGRLMAFGWLVVAGFIPTMSIASTILRYDFDVLITSTYYVHDCYGSGTCDSWEPHEIVYQGPPVSTFGTGSVTVDFSNAVEVGSGSDTRYGNIMIDYSILGLTKDLGFSNHTREATGFDRATGEITLSAMTYDDVFAATLFPRGPSGGFDGFGRLEYEQDRTGADRARVEFRFFNTSFSDLISGPEVLPAPLPAGLPLLLTGFAAFGALRRRQRSRR